MKQKRITKFLTSIGIAIMMVCTMSGTSQAALQATSTGTNWTNQTANTFFTSIRGMEAAGGTLGLTAEFETTTYLDTTKNGIDCHMIKNTEWGTMALLTDSIYGSKVSGSTNTTSTGNNTGVHGITSGGEYVAGIYKSSTSSTGYWGTIKTADARYYNEYSSGASIPGDATTETAKWKGASSARFVNSSSPVFYRGYSGVFAYNNYGDANSSNGSRAVVVVGSRTLIPAF